MLTFPYHSSSLKLSQGTWRQELEAEAMELALLKVEIVRIKATTTTWGLPDLFLIGPRTTCPEVAPATSGDLTYTHSSLIKKMPTACNGSTFSIQVLSDFYQINMEMASTEVLVFCFVFWKNNTKVIFDGVLIKDSYDLTYAF